MSKKRQSLPRIPLLLRDRQQNRKVRPDALDALDGYRTAHLLRQFKRDSQPEPGTDNKFHLIALDANKCMEESLLILGRNTQTGIRHCNQFLLFQHSRSPRLSAHT
ncbi:MAG: hypothetical protein PHT88_05365 [Candidatus Moranbacteria bacterium]|nr:hypothetical protein [Candidatus Moranbacteria bacterium]